MSKNIIVQIAGVSTELDNVEVIRAGSSNEDWVPEDEQTLGTISVVENGTYKAEDDGLYGYSSAVVDVPKIYVTGTGQDGKTHRVSVDSDGNLTDVILQDSIAVEKVPDLVLYSDGDTIDFTGIEVHAYDSDGGDLGVIAFEELVFPVTVAAYDESTIVPESATSDYDTGPIEKPFPFADEIHISFSSGTESTDKIESAEGRCTAWIQDATHAYIVLASDDSSAKYNGVQLRDYVSLGNKTVYYWAGAHSQVAASVVSVDPNAHSDGYASVSTTQAQNIAWTMFYGEIIREHALQEIPVQWTRTSDGEILETSFYIGVIRVTGGGGQAGENGTGRND